ncbi:hypothetical protein AAF712_005066 [Marasmius tenuissimus]|uniref:G domain-containing protein n=1 Tax=Marasmius tenuissimus TaxID=585030 RepID=A0ABR3A2S7_9AGAR
MSGFKRGRRLAGILYLHRISDTRMSGVSRRNFNMFKQLCGERTLRNVVIVTNMWGQVNAQTGEARETELGTSEDFFKPALDKGAKMVRYDNTPENALAILRDLLENEPLPLRIQTEIVEHQKHIWQTAAGEKIAPELAAQNGKHAAEKESFLKLVREEMDHQDEENRARVKKETGVLHAEIVRIRGEGARLAAQYDAEKHDMEQKMEEDHQAAEREAESQRREILDLYQRLQNEQSDSRAQREGLQRQLNEAVKCYERRGREFLVKDDTVWIWGGLTLLVETLWLASVAQPRSIKGSSLGLPFTIIPYSRSMKYTTDNSSTSSASMTGQMVPSASTHEPTAVIAVMGATGSGKTTFINAASGGSLRVGRGLQSCTNSVQLSPSFLLDGKQVTLIDTPGFDDTTKSDADILKMIAAFLASMYEHGQKLAGVIYLHRISDFRMGGISRRNFKMFKELCGENTLKNVAIVTNMWGEVSRDVGEIRETELVNEDKFFKPVLDKGAQIVRHDNTPETARAILLHLVQNQPLPLMIQTELVDQGKSISETAAGAELNRELMEQIRRHERAMRELQQEMQEAIKAKDEETRRELEVETKKLQAEMARVQNDATRLVSDYTTQKAQLEERMEEAKRLAEAERVEQQRRIDELHQKLREGANESSAERERLQQQLNEAIARYNQPRASGFFTFIGRALDNIFGW